MENKNVETKKPFYKKWWFIALAVIIVIAVISGLKGSDDDYYEKLVWSELELGEYLPEPEKVKGSVMTNRSDLAMFDVTNLTKKEYKAYVQKCIDKGYTLDLEFEPWDTVYGAFNEEGYSLRIIYLESEEEMSVTLKAPEQNTMKEITWATSGLSAMLPTPKSTLGNISWNNSEKFIAHMGNTTMNDYNDYVKACEDKGFTNEYSKSDKSYSAKNSDGYKVHLMYLGGNVMEISLSAPETKKEETNTQTTPETTDKKEENTSTNNNGLGKEFKEAMDSYEKFMDDYVAFMKKYKNSNGTDVSLLTDYSKYMTDYAEMVKDFAKWEDEDLNTAETAYYIDVQTRVNKKLLEVAY